MLQWWGGKKGQDGGSLRHTEPIDVETARRMKGQLSERWMDLIPIRAAEHVSRD